MEQSFTRDPASEGLPDRTDLAGENWDKHTRSPLTAQGVNVKVGDYILAINNTPVSGLANLYDALIGTADKQVILRVNSKPSDDGARDVTSSSNGWTNRPSTTWRGCRRTSITLVRKTNGEVGYLHIPDMGRPGLNEFTKLYFPQIRRRRSSSMSAVTAADLFHLW